MDAFDLVARIILAALTWELFRITAQERYWEIKKRMYYLITGKDV